MKILAVHNYYQIRSGEDLAFDAAVRDLRTRGHEVTVLSRDNETIRSNRATRMFLPFTTLFSLSCFLKIFRVTRRKNFDVALVQNVFPLLSPSIYLALKIRGLPIAQRLYNYRLVCPNGILFTQGKICERCRSGAYWNAVRFSCYRGSRAASAVMALSLALWRALGVWRWGPAIFLTPDEFLGEKVLPAIGDRSRLRKVYNPAPGAVLEGQPVPRNRDILFIGRLVRPKGIFTLIEVARRLPGRQFHLIGTGDDEAEARAAAAGLKNIVWRGPVYGTELEGCLRSFGSLVLPSEWYDNMPLVLTQALLARIPIVASRINGIPEFIIDGITGRLAEPGNAADFARLLELVFTHPEESERMAAEGLRRAKNWFAPDVSIAQLENALESLRELP